MTREVPRSKVKRIWYGNGRWFQHQSAAYYAIAKAIVVKRYPRWLQDHDLKDLIADHPDAETKGDIMAEADGVTNWRARRERMEELFYVHEYIDGYECGWHFDSDRWRVLVKRLAKFLAFVDARREASAACAG